MNGKHPAKDTAKAATFKAAFCADMHSGDVPLKARFQAMGVSASLGYQYADPHSHELPSVPRLINVLPTLTSTHALDFLARLQGHMVVPLPSPAGTEAAGLDRLSDVLERFASLVRWHATAIADGTFCERDANEYAYHAHELVRAALGQLEYVRSRVTTVPAIRKVGGAA